MAATLMLRFMRTTSTHSYQKSVSNYLSKSTKLRTQWQSCTTSFALCFSNSSSVSGRNNELSYYHAVGKEPLIGKTMGQIMDETTEKYPDRESHVFCADGIRRTFAQFKQETDKIALGFLALGIKKGDRVGMWGSSTLEWVLTQFALSRFGAIMVNINPVARTPELEYYLQKSGCKGIVCGKSFRTLDYYAMLQEICPELATDKAGQLKSARLPDLKTVIFRGEDSLPGTYNFPDLLNMGSSTEEKRLEEYKRLTQFDEPINIQFTSGTTGLSKGATLTHHNIVNNSNIVGYNLGYHEKQHIVCLPVPLYHCSGSVLGTLCGMVHGATCVFPATGYDVEATLRAVSTEKCTAFIGTPTMYIDLLNHPKLKDCDCSSLSTALMGGSSCPSEIVHQCTDKLNITFITVSYGLTEVSPLISQTTKDDPFEKKFSTVGKANDHNELKIIDEAGNIVPRNTAGELCSRGYTTMIGYWQDEKKTKEAIDESRWFHSGDLAVMDDEGYVSIVGRKKDMIIRGGENIYSVELEDFLYKHPKIEDVQVIGVPDERLGEIVCAWIKLKEGQTATEVEIKEFCKGEMAYFKVPKIVHFVKTFPMTVNGKVQKFQMRQEMQKMLKVNK
ncbi:medium-chain acyl-CoA ligase ACSF2, mitochondrial-like isoform X1 [Asterias rubens]|uniref:medium-chain acyl-CoA ligase ACSF2, mitochondrial-like isoform X1 n=1 Tax=Asterias rubens TaxID=7604 RepID=UPI0014555068|nr:medium-chain acyl-CoA ligase ACSF2, mitochondrial-like isoform X1 [Asterias rubens]